MKPASSARGTTLVEVLVTLLIVSVGMVAVMRMLTQSIVLLSDAIYEQRAAKSINDLADLLQGIPNDVLRALPEPEAHNCIAGQPCTAEHFYADSLARWTAQLARNLPQGTSQIEFNDATSPTVMRVRISWRSAGNDSAFRQSDIPVPDGETAT